MFAPFASSAVSAATTTSFIETTAVNGASYVTTGKGVSEHVMSGLADQDCKFSHVIDGKSICEDYQVEKIPLRDLSNRRTLGTSSPSSIEEVISQDNRKSKN
jgi:hypothetical protein